MLQHSAKTVSHRNLVTSVYLRAALLTLLDGCIPVQFQCLSSSVGRRQSTKNPGDRLPIITKCIKCNQQPAWLSVHTACRTASSSRSRPSSKGVGAADLASQMSRHVDQEAKTTWPTWRTSAHCCHHALCWHDLQALLRFWSFWRCFCNSWSQVIVNWSVLAFCKQYVRNCSQQRGARLLLESCLSPGSLC